MQSFEKWFVDLLAGVQSTARQRTVGSRRGQCVKRKILQVAIRGDEYAFDFACRREWSEEYLTQLRGSRAKPFFGDRISLVIFRGTFVGLFSTRGQTLVDLVR